MAGVVRYGLPTAGDEFVGVSNVTAGVRGTLAFAALFFGPLASNHRVDQAGFDALAAEFDGDLPAVDGAFLDRARLSFYRRPITNVTEYDPLRNLSRAGLHEPRDHACGSEYVECVPGPCSVWEYDYQFAGLQMSQVGGEKSRVRSLNATLSGFSDFSAELHELDDAVYYPMVGTVRCGPLFNFQYVDNRLSDGSEFDPAVATKADEFDVEGVVVPAVGGVPETTLEYVPVELPVDADVYPIQGEALVPVPHGVNLNPRWYFDGFLDCFSFETGLPLADAPDCDEAQLLLNWMYNMNPAELDCTKSTAPPPYAPAGPADVDDTSAPWRPLGTFRNVSGSGEFDDGPLLNEDPSLHPYTGNPRLQQAHLVDSSGGVIGGRAAVVGYVRGAEDGYFGGGGSENVSRYVLRDGTTDSVRHGVGVSIRGQHWPNGRGANHRITAQELPSAYVPKTCDFTQCRWVPRLPYSGTKTKHVLQRRHGHSVRREVTRKVRNYAANPSAAFAVAASELSVAAVDPLLIRDPHALQNPSPSVSNCTNSDNVTAGCDDRGNSAFQNYDRRTAWLNLVRAYGRQTLRFRRDVNLSWVANAALEEYYGRGFELVDSVDNTTTANLTATFECTTDCVFDASGECPPPFVGLPCRLEYACDDANFTSRFPCNVTTESNGAVRAFQPLCCAEFDPFGLVPDGVQGDSATVLAALKSDCLQVGLNFGSSTVRENDDKFKLSHAHPKVYDEPFSLNVGCRNFYARSEHLEVVSRNPLDDDGPAGRCRYNDVAWSMLNDNDAKDDVLLSDQHVQGDRNLPCYGMLGSQRLSSKGGGASRQMVVKRSELDGGLKTKKDSKHVRPFEWSRAQSVDGMGVAKYSTSTRFQAPGYTEMSCVDDEQAFFYELGTQMDYSYVKLALNAPGRSNLDFKGRVKFSYRHNLIPTALSLAGQNVYYNDGASSGAFPRRLFSANASAVDASFGSECNIRTFNGVGGPKNVIKVDGDPVETPGQLPNPPEGAVPNTGDHRCGVLTMMTFHSPKRVPGSRYRPLRAYYQETRAAEPLSPTSRSASYPNSNAVTNSHACDCRNEPPVWRWLDGAVLRVPSSLAAAARNFKHARVVVRTFSWRREPLHTSPIIGLYLPSSRAVFKVADRDFLRGSSGMPFDDRTRLVDATFGGVDSPGRSMIKNLTFDGVRYERGDDVFGVFPVQTFKYGSCVRWPYGQVPRLGLDAPTLARLYPNASRREYGLDAMMGYCERIAGSLKMQACANDPLGPSARHRFCVAHSSSSQHHVVGLAVDGSKRGFGDVCSRRHRTCLIVPGRDKFGSLRAVLEAHHREFRDSPSDGANWTFLVTPFNASMFDLLLVNRTLVPVGHGVDLENPGLDLDALSVPVSDSSSNVTGLAGDAEAFSMFDSNDHAAPDIVAAMTRLTASFLNSSDGCPSGEFRVPARSETLFSATECVSASSVLVGTPEAGARVHFPGSSVVSAVSDLPLRFGRVRHGFGACARLVVLAADVHVGPTVIDQTGCESPATALIVRRDGRGLDAPNVTVLGSSVASIATLEAASGSFLDVGGLRLGAVFGSPSGLDFRTHVAASGARGDFVEILYNGSAVVLPRAGGVINFSSVGRVVDLSSTVAEFAHGPLKKLYSTNAVGDTRWAATVITSAVLGSLLLVLLVAIIIRNSR